MSQSYVGSGGGDQEAECPSPVRYFLQEGCPSLRFHQLPNSATNGELSVHIHSLIGGVGISHSDHNTRYDCKHL